MDTIAEVGGNMVSINNTLIPALNIQVDGYPKVEERLDLWFGIYFEIMFEDGDLWVVDQGSAPGLPQEDHVFVEEIKNFAKEADRSVNGELMVFPDWAIFLEHYDRKRFPHKEE